MMFGMNLVHKATDLHEIFSMVVPQMFWAVGFFFVGLSCMLQTV